MQQLKYSLLLPVRNEVARIDGVARAIFDDLEIKGADPEYRTPVTLGDWEICFGDDFSDDGTFELLEKLSLEFPFRLIRPAQNIGRGAIRNLLAQEARAPMLFFLDGDCRVQPGFFKAWENPDPEIAHLGRIMYDISPKSGFSRFLSKGSGTSKLVRKEPIPPAYFISQNFCLSKTNFQKAGGFRTDLLGWGGEDVDLGYKIEKLSISMASNENAVAMHPSVIDLEAYFVRLKLFGKLNLPVLVQDNPKVGIQFKLRFALWPWSFIFCNPWIYWICFTLITNMVSVPWPFAFYRYTTFYSYASGYRSRKITISE